MSKALWNKTIFSSRIVGEPRPNKRPNAIHFLGLPFLSKTTRGPPRRNDSSPHGQFLEAHGRCHLIRSTQIFISLKISPEELSALVWVPQNAHDRK